MALTQEVKAFMRGCKVRLNLRLPRRKQLMTSPPEVLPKLKQI